jgi:hypothetical protein
MERRGRIKGRRRRRRSQFNTTKLSDETIDDRVAKIYTQIAKFTSLTNFLFSMERNNELV